MVHDDNSQSRRWCFSTIIGRPLPAHATSTMGAAGMNGGGVDNGASASLAVPSLLHNGDDGGNWTNSGGVEDGAMAASLAVCPSLVRWQQWQWHK
jgi:hypothetical protein